MSYVSVTGSWDRNKKETRRLMFTANRQMDVALYGGLTIACAVIGGLAFFLAKLLRRKGRDHSLYSMARNGKHFTNGRRKKESRLFAYEGAKHDVPRLYVIISRVCVVFQESWTRSRSFVTLRSIEMILFRNVIDATCSLLSSTYQENLKRYLWLCELNIEES